MMFIMECIAACVLFTLLVKLATMMQREAFTNDYPPVVTEELRKKQLIAEKPPAKKSDMVRKLLATIIFAILFALLLRHVNGITTFLKGTLTSYALWLVVDWYDFLVIDVLLAPFDKFYKASGVSAFEKTALWFHCKESIKGMLIGLVFAPVVGIIVTLL